MVELKFESIIQCSDGYVHVFDGNNTESSMEIRKYCNVTPSDKIKSSTNELTIKYMVFTTSNDTVTLSYTSVDPPKFSKSKQYKYITIIIFSLAKSCFGLFTAPTVFALDTFPDVYGEAKECTFYIIRNDITFQLLYTDLNFDGDCSSSDCTDKLTFHVSVNYNVNIGTVCNAKGQTEFRNGHYKFLIIRFKGSSAGKYRGFKGRIL